MTETINIEEKLQFGAEVGKVLNLVIHSLYTNKDIFLRELISNSSDACDKLRYTALSNPNLVSDSELKITISIDKEQKKLYIADNGIGMNRQDLIDNLGTIAHSGTQRFLEVMKEAQDKEKAVELIGKFGVGFYSAFMVADEVIVESCKAGESIGWCWRSKGDGEFIISKIADKIERGTKLTLILKNEESDFLDKFRIDNIIKTYSDHINYPIEFINDKGEIERLNSNSAIWVRAKDEISQSEHLDFYRSVAHVGGEPWMILHNKNEGIIEYTNLLYIPSIKPFDLFHPDRRCSVKLYVNKVFITEDNVQIIPQYMRFLRGIIDSPDLPLNISRETLQSNKIIDKIQKSLIKRVLSELKKKMIDDTENYKKFWNNFGSVLKEGLCEAINTENREGLLSVCRFYSTHNSNDDFVSLEEYIDRMKTDQEFIYYLAGNDLSSVRKSPQLEGFKTGGIEVLLLTDPVDDFWTNVVNEYKGKKFKSVTRASEDLEKFLNAQNVNNQDEKDSLQDNQDIASFVQYFAKVLDKLVSEVRISKKLTDSPVCLAVGDGSMDIRMERFLREQKQLSYKSAKILEINAKHPIITKMADEYKNIGENSSLEDVICILFNQACLLEGEELNDVNDFTHRVNNLLKQTYKI